MHCDPESFASHPLLTVAWKVAGVRCGAVRKRGFRAALVSLRDFAGRPPIVFTQPIQPPTGVPLDKDVARVGNRIVFCSGYPGLFLPGVPTVVVELVGIGICGPIACRCA